MESLNSSNTGIKDQDTPFNLPIYTDYERKWKRAWLLKRSLLAVTIISIFSLIPVLIIFNLNLNLLGFLIWFIVMFGSMYFGVNVELPIIDPLEDIRAPFLFLRSFKETTIKKRPDGKMRAGVHRLKIEHNLAELLDIKQAMGSMLILQEEPIRKTIPSWTGYAEESAPDMIVIEEDDLHWLETIERLIKNCRSTILLPGTTPGLTKELHLVKFHKHLDRLLVLMPPVSRAWFPNEEEEKKLHDRWSTIQQVIKKEHNMHLPDYDPRGMIYRPNQDLSINEKRFLGSKLDNLNSALKDLVTVLDKDCKPLSEVLNELKKQGFRQEFHNVFKRKQV